MAFFNRFYDTSCYLPLAGFLAFDDEVEQYLFCYVLRAGNVAAKHVAISVLKRLLRRLRQAFPRARLRIRLDAGFSGPELYEFFEAQKLEYVVGMAKNARLTDLAEPLMAEVRSDFEAGQETTRRYGECAYQAGSWSHERRVIVKAEVTTAVPPLSQGRTRSDRQQPNVAYRTPFVRPFQLGSALISYFNRIVRPCIRELYVMQVNSAECGFV